MESIIPYLTFEGCAGEALAFYSQALGGEVLYSQSFKDAGQNGQVAIAADWQDKIMHAAFKAGDLQLMVSDTPDAATKVSAGDQVQLALNFTSEQQIDQVFERLSIEGTVTMALAKTFWGAKFAMLTDRFGVKWMLNFDYESPSEESQAPES